MRNPPSHLHQRNAPVMEKRQDPLPDIITNPQGSATSQTTAPTDLVFATGAPTSTGFPATTSSAPQPTQSTASSSQDSGDGTSTAVKAGIAFGVLGGVLILALLLYFVISRRRKQARERNSQNDREKMSGVSRPARPDATPEDSPKPALALDRSANFSAAGNVNKPLPSPAYSAAEAEDNGPSDSNAWLYPRNNRNSTYSNPFDNEMATVSSLNTDDRSIYTRNRSPSPISVDEAFPERPVTRFMPGIPPASSPAPASPAVGPLTRKASLRKDAGHGKTALPMTPGLAITSPFGNEYAVGLPPPNEPAVPQANGPTHRVQLDFKPTLDDEMELRAGELIRVIHEFDDGWALCLRLDGSRQGIVPRTCLSASPVRPRPGSPTGSPAP